MSSLVEVENIGCIVMQAWKRPTQYGNMVDNVLFMAMQTLSISTLNVGECILPLET